MKEKLLAMENVYVVHITGPKEIDTVNEELSLTEEEKKRYLAMGYQDHMGETLAAADLIVSRAGASSLAEISARCIRGHFYTMRGDLKEAIRDGASH